MFRLSKEEFQEIIKAAEMLPTVTPEGSLGRENYDLGIPYSLFIASDEMTHCLPNLQTS